MLQRPRAREVAVRLRLMTSKPTSWIAKVIFSDGVLEGKCRMTALVGVSDLAWKLERSRSCFLASGIA
jgi:hypothetical protein